MLPARFLVVFFLDLSKTVSQLVSAHYGPSLPSLPVSASDGYEQRGKVGCTMRNVRVHTRNKFTVLCGPSRCSQVWKATYPVCL